MHSALLSSVRLSTVKSSFTHHHSLGSLSAPALRRQHSVFRKTPKYTGTVRQRMMSAAAYSGVISNEEWQKTLHALGSLQSNASAMKDWAAFRQTGKDSDENPIVPMMNSYLQQVGIYDAVQKLPVIHITGTKGKGSTAAFTESILRSHGLKTGLYTSPDLRCVTERICINGKNISRHYFSDLFWRVHKQLSAPTPSGDPFPLPLPMYFRYITLMSLWSFVEQKVDVAVVEVGIGGRTDATNVFLAPRVCLVSRIDYDHVEVLGHTLTDIAREKSGIFKRGAVALTCHNQAPEAVAQLERSAAQLDLKLQMAPPLTAFSPLPALGLAGDFQQENASLAVAGAAQFLRLPLSTALPTSFSSGLATASWPGRAQQAQLTRLSKGTPSTMDLFIDGAHTPASLAVCVEWYAKASGASAAASGQSGTSAANGVHPQPHRSLLYWCKSNRDPHTLISSLYHSLRDNRVSFDVIYVCCPHTIHRAVAAATAAEDLLHAEALARVWRSVLEEEKHSSVFGQPAPTVAVFDSPLQALDRLFASLSVGQQSRCLITGSLYLVGAALDAVDDLTKSAPPH